MNYRFFVNEIIIQSRKLIKILTFKTRSDMAKLLNLKTKDFGI